MRLVFRKFLPFFFNVRQLNFHEQYYIVVAITRRRIYTNVYTAEAAAAAMHHYIRANNQCRLPTLLLLEYLVCSNPFLPMNGSDSVWRAFYLLPHHDESRPRIFGASLKPVARGDSLKLANRVGID